MYRFALDMPPENVEAVATLLYVEMLESGLHPRRRIPLPPPRRRDGAPYANLAEMAHRDRRRRHRDDRHRPDPAAGPLRARRARRTPPSLAGQRRFIGNDLDRLRARCSTRRGRPRPAARLPSSASPPTRCAPRRPTTWPPSPPGRRRARAHPRRRAGDGSRGMVDLARQAAGRRPARHAPRRCALRLIHATHMTPRPNRIAGAHRRRRRTVSGHGSKPRRRHISRARVLAAGGRFGVGTDFNVLIGVADELRQLEYGQRLKHRERNVLSGGSVPLFYLSACRPRGSTLLLPGITVVCSSTTVAIPTAAFPSTL